MIQHAGNGGPHGEQRQIVPELGGIFLSDFLGALFFIQLHLELGKFLLQGGLSQVGGQTLPGQCSLLVRLFPGQGEFQGGLGAVQLAIEKMQGAIHRMLGAFHNDLFGLLRDVIGLVHFLELLQFFLRIGEGILSALLGVHGRTRVQLAGLG